MIVPPNRRVRAGLLCLAFLSTGVVTAAASAEDEVAAQEHQLIKALAAKCIAYLQSEEGLRTFFTQEAHPEDLKAYAKMRYNVDRLVREWWYHKDTLRDYVKCLQRAQNLDGGFFDLEHSVYVVMHKRHNTLQRGFMFEKADGRWYAKIAPHREEIKSGANMMYLDMAKRALQAHHAAEGRYPKSMDDLKKKLRYDKDSWGKPFLYKPSPDGKSFELTTLGADGKPGGVWIYRDQTVSSEKK